jgi:hypothetical protein
VYLIASSNVIGINFFHRRYEILIGCNNLTIYSSKDESQKLVVGDIKPGENNTV